MEHVGNQLLLDEAWKYVKKQIGSGCFRLSPTKKLVSHRGRPIAASDLKVGEHFTKIDHVDQAHKEWIMEAMHDVFSHTSKYFERRLMKPIALCIGNILAKMVTPMSSSSNTTAPEITSEAELRFAVADPIIEMLCNSWGYQVTK